MPTREAGSRRRTRVLDPLVAAEVEESRSRFARGEATVSLAELIQERRLKSVGTGAKDIEWIAQYKISEYEH